MGPFGGWGVRCGGRHREQRDVSGGGTVVAMVARGRVRGIGVSTGKETSRESRGRVDSIY